jgi:hypothetical protein
MTELGDRSAAFRNIAAAARRAPCAHPLAQLQEVSNMKRPTNLASACLLTAGLLLAPSLGGCMLSPTDDGTVSSSTAALPFNGFLTSPAAPVFIRAWNYTSNQMEDVGPQVLSGTLPYSVDGGPLYYWETSQVLPSQYWRTGPGGGQCASVGAQTVSNGARYNTITVEEDWASCWNANPSVGGFYNNCRSDDAPVAKIYTESWGEATINQATLNLAGAIATTQISLVFDNYTLFEDTFCHAGNPDGCPPGLSADPELYQFYQPNASSITKVGEPRMQFSITPTRQDPLTIYIDDLRSQRLTFSTSGDRFVLGIAFEDADPEIRMNCIRNLLCWAYPSTMELGTPRASISFGLQLQDGRVTYGDAQATFTTSSTGGNEQSAAAAIGAAMTDKLNNEPTIKASVAAALDQVLRQSANLGGLTMDSLTVGGGVVRIRPGCGMD